MIGVTAEAVRQAQSSAPRSEDRVELVQRLWRISHERRMEMVRNSTEKQGSWQTSATRLQRQRTGP